MRDNASGADNQQETSISIGGSSETTRQAPSTKVCKAYLFGALHDGTFNRYNQRHRFSQAGTEWLLILKRCLKIVGNSSWIYREGAKRYVYVLETQAKFLNVNFDPLQLRTREEKIAYIRGFFDAEGGIPRDPKARFYIQLVQNDRNKLEKIKLLLEDLGIRIGKIHNPSHRVDPDYFRMYVLADSHKIFFETVGTWHPRKVRTLARRVKI